jgi:hypothetical protein
MVDSLAYSALKLPIFTKFTIVDSMHLHGVFFFGAFIALPIPKNSSARASCLAIEQ